MKTELEPAVYFGAVGKPLPNWRDVKIADENLDNDEDEPIRPEVEMILGFDPDDPEGKEARNRAMATEVLNVSDALREDTAGLIDQLTQALGIDEPAQRGDALRGIIAKIPGMVGDVEATVAVLEEAIEEAVIEGADQERKSS